MIRDIYLITFPNTLYPCRMKPDVARKGISNRNGTYAYRDVYLAHQLTSSVRHYMYTVTSSIDKHSISVYSICSCVSIAIASTTDQTADQNRCRKKEEGLRCLKNVT